MGDERRDFDTSGRTNGQQDQTEPTPPQDETQPPDETQSPDGTEPLGTPNEIQPPAEAQPPDQTQPFAAPEEIDHTRALPPQKQAWSGRAQVSPPPAPSLRDSAPYTREMPQAEQPRPWWTPVLLGGLALGLLGILILVAWWMGRDSSPPPVDVPSQTVVVPTETAQPATQPPTTPADSPTAQVVQVPHLVGLELDAAVAALDNLGLAYRFDYRQDDAPEGRVIGSSPPEGLVVPVQTTVTLVISTGRERSPTPSPTPASAASATPN